MPAAQSSCECQWMCQVLLDIQASFVQIHFVVAKFTQLEKFQFRIAEYVSSETN